MYCVCSVKSRLIVCPAWAVPGGGGRGVGARHSHALTSGGFHAQRETAKEREVRKRERGRQGRAGSDRLTMLACLPCARLGSTTSVQQRQSLLRDDQHDRRQDVPEHKSDRHSSPFLSLSLSPPHTRGRSHTASRAHGACLSLSTHLRRHRGRRSRPFSASLWQRTQLTAHLFSDDTALGTR